MSLDISLRRMKMTEVFGANITHNLGPMADRAGIYDYLWHPETMGIKTASQLIGPLERAIDLMKMNPELYKQLEPENKWGTYDNFIPWLEKLLEACKAYPESSVNVWI